MMQQPILIGPQADRGGDYRTQLARALMGQRAKTGHWSDGLADAGSMLSGAFLAKSAQDDRQSNRKDALAALLQGNESGASMQDIAKQLMAMEENPFATQLGQQTLFDAMANQRGIKTRDEQREYDARLAAAARAQELEDLASKREYDTTVRADDREFEDTRYQNRRGDKNADARSMAEFNAGLRPQDLVAIYDESSPTGTRLVPKSEAVGQPAAKKDPLVNLNTAKPPKGFKYSDDGLTLEPIKGGPADIEARELEKKAALAQKGKKQIANVVVDDIDRVKALVNESILPATGFGSETAAGFAGTNAADVKRLLDSIKANISFDSLQALRDASPTGGALGAVSERELNLLQSRLGSLDQSLSADEFNTNLDRVKELYQQTIHGPSGGDLDISDLTFDGQPVTEDDIAATMQKHNLSRQEVIDRLRGGTP